LGVVVAPENFHTEQLAVRRERALCYAVVEDQFRSQIYIMKRTFIQHCENRVILVTSLEVESPLYRSRDAYMLPKRDRYSAGPPVRRFPRWILLLRLETCDLERAVVLCSLQAPCNDNSSTRAAAPQPPSFPTPPGVFASRPVQLPGSPDRRDRAERGGISFNSSRPVPGAP
jgi:hypothetical protein